MKSFPEISVMEPVQNAIFSIGAPGYDSLAGVLARAFMQAATGKGHERHAQGEPFDEQVMQDGARRFGVGGLLFQAFKKSEESQRLPHDRAIAELLGAINYLAGAVIHLEKTQPAPVAAAEPAPANLDSRPYSSRKWAAMNAGKCAAKTLHDLCRACKNGTGNCKAVE